MATDGYVNRWNAVAYPAVEERRLASILMAPGTGGGPFSARHGRRVNGSGLNVTIGGSPEAISVTAGGGVIFGPAYAAGGPWIFEIPNDVQVSLPARPGAGQSRIDLVVARVYDPDSSVGLVREVKIERVNGTASATPSAPTAPALTLELARLVVPASGTITVTESTARTVAAGGVLPVGTTSDRDGLTAYRGLVVHNGQTGRLEVYDGTTWQTVSQPDDSEWVNIGIASGYQGENTPLFGVPGQRRMNGVLHFRGAISRITGSFPASSVTTIANLGTNSRPSETRDFHCAGSTAATDAKIRVGSDGVVAIITGPTVPSYISLADISYPLG